MSHWLEPKASHASRHGYATERLRARSILVFADIQDNEPWPAFVGIENHDRRIGEGSRSLYRQGQIVAGSAQVDFEFAVIVSHASPDW